MLRKYVDIYKRGTNEENEENKRQKMCAFRIPFDPPC